MGVCNSVSKLAQAVLDSDFSLNLRQELQLEILKLGPLYLGINNLPSWESAFQETLLDEDDESRVGILINEAYDLAMLNMYGAFNISRTKEAGSQVVEIYGRSGVNVSIRELEFECW